VARPSGRSAADRTKRVVARARRRLGDLVPNGAGKPDCSRASSGDSGIVEEAPPGLTVVLVCPITAPLLRLYRGLLLAG
jgi:hypothetical protein